jgi:hypothetical protein
MALAVGLLPIFLCCRFPVTSRQLPVASFQFPGKQKLDNRFLATSILKT